MTMNGGVCSTVVLLLSDVVAQRVPTSEPAIITKAASSANSSQICTTISAKANSIVSRCLKILYEKFQFYLGLVRRRELHLNHV